MESLTIRQILGDKKRESSINVVSLVEADCDTDRYLGVATIRVSEELNKAKADSSRYV